jgi:hypothetical protein
LWYYQIDGERKIAILRWHPGESAVKIDPVISATAILFVVYNNSSEFINAASDTLGMQNSFIASIIRTIKEGLEETNLLLHGGGKDIEPMSENKQ